VHVQFWRCCFVSYRLNADAPSLGSQKVCERSPGSSAGARAFQARLVVGEVAQDVGHHVPGDRGQGMSGVFAFPGVLNLGVIRWAYTVEGRLLETLAKGLIVRVPALPAGCAKAWPRPGRCARQDRDLPRPLGQLEVLGQCTALHGCAGGRAHREETVPPRRRLLAPHSRTYRIRTARVGRGHVRRHGTYEEVAAWPEHRWPSPKFHCRSYTAALGCESCAISPALTVRGGRLKSLFAAGGGLGRGTGPHRNRGRQNAEAPEVCVSSWAGTRDPTRRSFVAGGGELHWRCVIGQCRGLERA
jgi:hypothetical protein